jgi:hypothetical protein
LPVGGERTIFGLATGTADGMISECLDCIVGGTHVAIPVDRVERLIEYSVGLAPPLAHSWVGGIGLLDDQLFVSVRLRGGAADVPRREAKGLLVRAPDGRPRWALEVDRIVGTFELHGEPEIPRRAPALVVPSGWLFEVPRRDRETMVWLDVAAVDATLAEAPEADRA